MIAAANDLAALYAAVRGHSVAIAAPLSVEDQVIQSMPDASPTRWHLAHTTWFFETFLLKTRRGYRPFDDRFERLFNSYYNGVGEPLPRDRRGTISRPGVDEVTAYRAHVDAAMTKLLDDDLSAEHHNVLAIGLHHEQQHQELMLTDIKHALGTSPLLPAYDEAPLAPGIEPTGRWHPVTGGIHEIGHDGGGFAFDNESPRHRVHVDDYEIAADLIRCQTVLDFINDGGYRTPRWWLSAGWSAVEQHRWRAPLYWFITGDDWSHQTMAGPRPVDPRSIATHLSYFEADAIARWLSHQTGQTLTLPTECQWEIAAADQPIRGLGADRLLAQNRAIHPTLLDNDSGLPGCYLTAWQWTASQYTAYPGYRPPEGTLGEYNGKFMCNQFVLRGGSCATPSANHLRPTYRNFFPADARWQFTGMRLVRS